jgi:hypothetical protein
VGGTAFKLDPARQVYSLCVRRLLVEAEAVFKADLDALRPITRRIRQRVTGLPVTAVVSLYLRQFPSPSSAVQLARQ